LFLIMMLLPVIVWSPVVVLGESTEATEYFRITVSNGTVYIAVGNLEVIRYQGVVLRYGFINFTTFEVIYSAVSVDPSSLPIIRVEVYGLGNGTMDTLASVVFNPRSADTETITMVLPIHVEGYNSIRVEFYDVEKGVLIKKDIVPAPKQVLTGDIAQYLSLLIPAAVLFAFAVRGSLRDVGLGFLFAGIVYLLLPYIGVEIYNSMFTSSVAIALGLLFLYLSAK